MTSPARPQNKLGFWLTIILGGLVALMGFLFIAGCSAKNALQAQHPAPGQLVDVGGYKLHLTCMGTGQPTVILEAGMGNAAFIWAHVQPAIAQTTRVCVYDRAGLGWSEVSPRPRLSADMVDELHLLLTNAQITPPYVLVGHSMGGMLTMHYAHLYPQEVAGLVLVDAQHPDWAVRSPAALAPVEAQLLKDAEGQVGLIKFLVPTGLLALAPSIVGSDPRLPPEVQLSDQALNATRVSIAETAIAEFAASKASLQQVYALGITRLGDLPLYVLAAGQRDAAPASATVSAETLAELDTIGAELQRKFATLSPNSQFILVEDSGHFIQLDKPEVVIEAILAVVAAAEK